MKTTEQALGTRPEYETPPDWALPADLVGQVIQIETQADGIFETTVVEVIERTATHISLQWNRGGTFVGAYGTERDWKSNLSSIEVSDVEHESNARILVDKA